MYVFHLEKYKMQKIKNHQHWKIGQLLLSLILLIFSVLISVSFWAACFARSSAPSVRVAKNFFFLHRQKISKKSGKYGCCGPFFILLHTMSPFWHIYMGRHLERYQFSFLAFVRKSPEQTAPKKVCRLIINPTIFNIIRWLAWSMR